MGKRTEPTSVKVAVRCRPLVPKEILDKSSSCVNVVDADQQIVIGTKGFRFDYVFNPHQKQSEIYDRTVSPLVEAIFDGYNATVLAYGQTGSGKTHTMTGSMSQNDSNMGIIPRVIKDIFDRVEETKESYDYLIRVSYMEIYKEGLRDLLRPKSKSLVIREDEKKGIVVMGVKEEIVESYQDMQRCLETGALYRTTGSTLMNEHSSRSHSIFTIYLEKRAIEETEENAFTSAKFHLVDLAGSERNKRTGAVGNRFKEAVQINSGLLALGNVISALGDEKRRKHIRHVPYRESKLTRLLTDSLGGNSQTLMIACVSPADTSFEETLNTLKYANRARNIKNKPVVNRDPHASELARMKLQIKNLQEQLDNQTGEGNRLSQQYISTLSEMNKEETSHLKQQNDALNREIAIMSDELNSANDTVAELSENLFLVKNTRDKFQRKLQEGLIQLKHTISSLKSIKNSVKLNDRMSQEVNELIRGMEQWCAREDKEHENSHKIPEKINNLLQSTTQVTRSQVSMDMPSDQVIAKQQAYIQQLEDELKEARGDLFRDEQIFSDKIKEIKELKKNLQILQEEKLELEKQAEQSIFERELDRDPFEKQKEVKNDQLFFNVPRKDSKENNRYEIGFGSSVSTLEVMEQNILELTKQKEDLELQKKLTEEEKATLEEQANLERQEHDLEQEQLKNNLNNLTVMIRLKQELIRDLMKKGSESQVVESEYQSKLEQMEKEMQESNVELQRAISQISEKAAEAAQKEKEKLLIKKKFNEKLAQLKAEISQLKKRNQAGKKLRKEHLESNKRVKELEHEVNRMKQQQKSLKEKIKTESAKLEEKQASRVQQIATLRRDAHMSHKKIKELETENQRQKKILLRKSEQLQHFQKQLTKFAQQEKERKRTKHQRAWLDREAEAYMRKKEKIEKLEKELQRRVEIIRKREITSARKEKIRQRQIEKRDALEKGISSLGLELENLENHLTQMDQEDIPGIESLKKKIKMVLKQKKNLETKKLEEEYREEEEMRQLDDMTEVLDAEIEYKTEAIAQAKEAIKKDGTDAEAECLNDIHTIQDAKQVLRSFFRKIIDLKEAEEKKESKFKEVQMNFEESQKVIENLTNNIRLTKAVAEKRMTKQKKEFEAKLQSYKNELEEKNEVLSNQQSLTVDAHEKEQKIISLEKDIWYLKKNLHSQRAKYQKLKKSTSVSEDVQSQQLQDENKRLKRELNNLKKYFVQHYSGGIVRKSVKDVRQIGEKDVRPIVAERLSNRETDDLQTKENLKPEN